MQHTIAKQHRVSQSQAGQRSEQQKPDLLERRAALLEHAEVVAGQRQQEQTREHDLASDHAR